MKKLTLLTLAAILAGCGLLSPIQEQAAKKVADGVNTYCQETDANFRAKFREDVNAQTEGHTIRVDCAE